MLGKTAVLTICVSPESNQGAKAEAGRERRSQKNPLEVLQFELCAVAEVWRSIPPRTVAGGLTRTGSV